MNPLQDTLPLHLSLTLMRLFGSNGALPFWNANGSNSGLNFDPMQMASPFNPLNLLNAMQPKDHQNPFMPNPLQAWAWQMEREAKHEKRMQARAKSEKQSTKSDASAKEIPNNPFIEAFSGIVNNEAFARTQGFLEGLQAVASSDYSRPESTHAVIWQRGSASLIDYAPDKRESLAILLIPSLINRYYILDLTPSSSFILFLKASGFRPLVMDWGAPSEDEQNYNCADYISALALDAAVHLRENHDGPMALLGYCMGGVFAVAMAQLAPTLFDAIILLATPWDFSSEDSTKLAVNDATGIMLKHWLMQMDPVPQPVINTLFHLIDPFAIQRRYSKFPHLTDNEKAHFLAVEHWLNDGTALSNKVACEGFVDWPLYNTLHEGKWKVGRTWIEPEAVRIATLCVIPDNDRVVAKGCAIPLSKRLPRCNLLEPSLGHVSMVVGKHAKNDVWQPIVNWLNERF